MKRVLLFLVLSTAVAAAYAALRPRGPRGVDEFSAEEVEKILSHSPLPALPPDPTNAAAERPAAARLGQRIFFDRRFSRDGTVSCASCHDPAKGFADGEALSSRFGLDRHVPTLWNAARQRWFFWDGRADTLWSQALQPLENPKEHGTTRAKVVELLRGDAALKADYEAAFGPLGGDVDRGFADVGKALAAYMRKLTAGRSAFDRFVEGVRDGDAAKRAVLSPAARRGLKLFVGRGQCRLCHGGPLFSDGEFHDLGLPAGKGGLSPARHEGIRRLLADPFNGAGRFSDAPELGAKKLAGLAAVPESQGQWKTPSLRNVARTAPYMHEGQFATLRDVARFYSTLRPTRRGAHVDGSLLIPLDLSEDESEGLVAFLESLTDEGVDPALLKPLD